MIAREFLVLLSMGNVPLELRHIHRLPSYFSDVFHAMELRFVDLIGQIARKDPESVSRNIMSTE